MDKVWVVTHESNVDGEIYFDVNVFKTENSAIEALEAKKRWIKEEHGHFGGFDENDEDFIIEENHNRSFYIEDVSDSYYEDINVFQTNLN